MTMYDQLNSAVKKDQAPFAAFCEGCQFWGDVLEENLAGGVKNVVKSCTILTELSLDDRRRRMYFTDNNVIQRLKWGFKCHYGRYLTDAMLSICARR